MFSEKKLKKFSNIIAKKIKNSKININYFSTPYKYPVIDNFFEKDPHSALWKKKGGKDKKENKSRVLI
jgi:hypothetical protein